MPPLVFKLHVSSHQRKQRVVLTLPNIHAGLMFRAALPDQNRSRIHKLPAKALHTKPLPV
jgi:hypothetical protein